MFAQKTGFRFPPLTAAHFNFNSPHGACLHCHGRGGNETVIEEYIPFNNAKPLDQTYSLLKMFSKKQSGLYQKTWNAYIKSSPPTQIIKDKFLYGDSLSISFIEVIDGKPRKVETKWKGFIELVNIDLLGYPGKSRFSSSDFVQWKLCKFCQGARLNQQSLFCRIEGKAIHELCSMNVSSLLKTISKWNFNKAQSEISSEIISAIINRLIFLEQVDLGYLYLNQQGSTLSYGESHRVQLASQIGSKLSGILYVLDEPTAGLHKQDVKHLSKVLKELKSLGNTILLVDHDKTLISQADQIIEIGPGSGNHGGNVVFQGSYDELLQNKTAPTALWNNGTYSMPIKSQLRKPTSFLDVGPVTCNNLKNFQIKIPLGILTGFCGVSGSGKSTLVIDVIANTLSGHKKNLYPIHGWEGKISLITQNNTNASSRSTPATYVNIMSPLKKIFSETKLAQSRGYTPSHFSLHKRGGRCESCAGMGEIRITMSFLPDAYVVCDICNGKRYNYETLQVTWHGHSIADILEMSVEKALQVFNVFPDIANKLILLKDLGLEYLCLGQKFSTLSGGEIQRLRLVSELTKKKPESTLYLLDEPSAGLHDHDIEKLIKILNRLVSTGNSIFMVEHNIDLLKQSDWIIELGPKGGPNGGKLIFEGTIEHLALASTPTGKLLSF